MASTAMVRRTKRADTAIENAGGDVRDLFPTRQREGELSEYMAAVPVEYHSHIWEVAKHFANTTHQAMAAAAGALIMEQAFEANSSFGMWAHTASTGALIGRGANVAPGTIYSFASYQAGVAQVPDGVTFTRGQRFFGLTTGPIDSNNGWTFVGNSVKLLSDAISGIESDTSFVNWRPEIVRARLIRGEYEGFEIRELTTIPFVASAYIPTGMPAAPSVEGLSVLFWDDRCLSKELTWLDMDNMNYDTMVRELVQRMDAGRITKGLLREYVPEGRRGSRR